MAAPFTRLPRFGTSYVDPLTAFALGVLAALLLYAAVAWAAQRLTADHGHPARTHASANAGNVTLLAAPRLLNS